MRILISAVILLATGNGAIADYLDVNLASYHSSSWYDYNNNNLGLGYSKGLSQNLELITGFYENSFYTQTVYGGVDLHTSDRRGFRAGISLGIATGYISPFFALPNITYRVGNIRTKIGYIPEIGGDTQSNAVTLQVGYKF